MMSERHVVLYLSDSPRAADGGEPMGRHAYIEDHQVPGCVEDMCPQHGHVLNHTFLPGYSCRPTSGTS